MARRPQKPDEPSLLDQLSGPLRDFVQDFKTHGKSVLEKVRERNPEKYLELSTKLLPLVAALNPGADDFADCTTPNDVGMKLLKSVGMSEFDMSEPMIADALKARDDLVDALEAIRDRAVQ